MQRLPSSSFRVLAARLRGAASREPLVPQALWRPLHGASAAAAKAEAPSAKAGGSRPPPPGGAAAASNRSAGGPGGVAASPSSAAPAPEAVKYDFFKPAEAPHQRVYAPPPPAVAAAAAAAGWTLDSKRVGVLALKCGMTADWDKWGVRRALTVMKLESVVVTGVVKADERGYTALQVGAGLPKPKTLTRAERGKAAMAGHDPRSHYAEFRVTPESLLPVGTPIPVQHFVPGQYVCVRGQTQGKGFQGGMKRWGFKGLRASHGVSVSHRSLGSTGNRQDPGKVIKGKKMPGHMGGGFVTTDGLRVYKADLKRGLLYLEGSVPGKAGGVHRLVDSPKRSIFSSSHPPPFPVYAETPEDRAAQEAWRAADAAVDLLAAVRANGGVIPEGLTARYGAPYEVVAPPPAIDPFAIPEDDEDEAS